MYVMGYMISWTTYNNTATLSQYTSKLFFHSPSFAFGFGCIWKWMWQLSGGGGICFQCM